jgi:hypothetical protein
MCRNLTRKGACAHARDVTIMLVAMRKVWLSWLLPLLMLVAQQGAYWHELSHLRPPAEQTEEKKQAAEKLCTACLAFAHLADLTTARSFEPGLLSLGFAAAQPPFASESPADAPVARSRGPPLFL